MLYDTGIDVLGVLLARAAGRPLSELFAERILGPLGMTDTAFHAVDPARLATAYMPAGDGLEVLDPPDGAFAAAAAVRGAELGLVSTAADVLRFYTAMADGGAPVVRRAALACMTADALTDDATARGAPDRRAGRVVGPGAPASTSTRREPWMAPGRWGWTGGTGTTAYVDPSRDTVCVLLRSAGWPGRATASTTSSRRWPPRPPDRRRSDEGSSGRLSWRSPRPRAIAAGARSSGSRAAGTSTRTTPGGRARGSWSAATATASW